MKTGSDLPSWARRRGPRRAETRRTAQSNRIYEDSDVDQIATWKQRRAHRCRYVAVEAQASHLLDKPSPLRRVPHELTRATPAAERRKRIAGMKIRVVEEAGNFEAWRQPARGRVVSRLLVSRKGFRAWRIWKREKSSRSRNKVSGRSFWRGTVRGLISGCRSFAHSLAVLLRAQRQSEKRAHRE